MPVVTLILTLAFVAGLLFGSFLNVCIARLPRGESIVSPRSRCPGCRAPIPWFQNIPLVSYAVLRGRCKACGERISLRYPAVELLTGLWFVLACLPLAHTTAGGDELLRLIVQSAADCTVGVLLLGLCFIDWEHLILPDELTYSGIFAGVLFACTQAIFLAPDQDDILLHHAPNINAANSGQSPGNVFLTGPEHLIFGRVFAAVAAFLLLYLIRIAYRALRKRDGMGLGDAKLLAMIAAFLGLTPTILALFVGLMLASVYGVALLLKGKGHPLTRLPFGSFLAIGGLFATLYGQRLADAYLSLFR